MGYLDHSTIEWYSQFIFGQQSYTNFLPNHIVINTKSYYFETRKDPNYPAKEIKVQRRKIKWYDHNQHTAGCWYRQSKARSLNSSFLMLSPPLHRDCPYKWKTNMSSAEMKFEAREVRSISSFLIKIQKKSVSWDLFSSAWAYISSRTQDLSSQWVPTAITKGNGRVWESFCF